MTWTTLSRELKDLDTMNNLGLWLMIHSQLVYQLIHVLLMVPGNGAIWFRAQLVYLDFGPQTGVINKIYNLLHRVLG